MKTYRFWAKADAPAQRDGQQWDIACYGGSNISLEDALRQANERAQSVAAAIARGESKDRYSYKDRPLREELIKEIDNGRQPN